MSNIVEKTEAAVTEAQANANKVDAFIKAHPYITAVASAIIALPVGAIVYAIIF